MDYKTHFIYAFGFSFYHRIKEPGDLDILDKILFDYNLKFETDIQIRFDFSFYQPNEIFIFTGGFEHPFQGPQDHYSLFEIKEKDIQALKDIQKELISFGNYFYSLQEKDLGWKSFIYHS